MVSFCGSRPQTFLRLCFFLLCSRTLLGFHPSEEADDIFHRSSLSDSFTFISTSVSQVDSEFDTRVFRKNLTRSKNYSRRGFDHQDETLKLMNLEYTSDIIKALKKSSSSTPGET